MKVKSRKPNKEDISRVDIFVHIIKRKNNKKKASNRSLRFMYY